MLPLAFALALVAASPPQRTVLVMDLVVREGVSKDLAGTLSELMGVEVRKVAHGDRIYSSADVKALLNFRKEKALLGCEDQSCLAELGGALGAQEIVTGSLSTISDDYVVVLRRMDVAKAKVIDETTANVPRTAPARLQREVLVGVDRLWGIQPVPEQALAVSETREAHHHPTLAWTMFGIAAAAVAVSVVGWVELNAFEQYKSSHATASTAVTLSDAQPQQGLGVFGEVAGIAGAGVAVAAGTTGFLVW